LKIIAIVGGGILGLAIAYQLTRKERKLKIHLFEKEDNLGMHQSGNNSGVLHCGLYYKPGSLKAKLAVEGINEMIAFCKEYELNHEVCGKIVVASNDREIGFLDNLAQRGQQNGLEGLKYLTKDELRLREPHVKAEKALLVPQEGIVDYKQVMNQLSKLIQDYGGKIHLGEKVISAKEIDSTNIALTTEKEEYSFNLIINCAGLFSDRNYRNLVKKNSPIKIVPFRGEYLNVREEYKDLVNHLIYPVPDPKYPFLGVHFTRMINGGREVGPNAVLALKREGYKNTDFSLLDTLDSLTYKGFINFLIQNFSFAMGEFFSSISTASFVAKAKKLIPEVEEHMFVKGGTAGVRAQALSTEGELLMDFNILREGNQVHVLNAPSPGATASLSIAKHIIENYIK
jgi:L-2-hydroxyglutarate oxidase